MSSSSSPASSSSSSSSSYNRPCVFEYYRKFDGQWQGRAEPRYCFLSDCPYVHTIPRPHRCILGEKCYDWECPLLHPHERGVPCRYGKDCWNKQNCTFQHPPSIQKIEVPRQATKIKPISVKEPPPPPYSPQPQLQGSVSSQWSQPLINTLKSKEPKASMLKSQDITPIMEALEQLRLSIVAVQRAFERSG